MRTNRRGWPWHVVALAAMAFGSGCQGKDVGEDCHPKMFGSGGAAPVACTDSTQDTADFFESGPANNCENLICIHAAKEGCVTLPGETQPTLSGKCSKPCVSDADCFRDETGMVCRKVVLSEAFITWLQQNNPAALQRYLADIQSSSYCALPVSTTP